MTPELAATSSSAGGTEDEPWRVVARGAVENAIACPLHPLGTGNDRLVAATSRAIRNQLHQMHQWCTRCTSVTISAGHP
jgi:hypothetical protein